MTEGALGREVAAQGAEEVRDFEARGVRALPLALGSEGTELTWLVVEPGGSLGRHVAGRDQLFVVVEGSGWLEIHGARTELATGQSGVIKEGQDHAKGSEAGMVALVVQAPRIQVRGAQS